MREQIPNMSFDKIMLNPGREEVFLLCFTTLIFHVKSDFTVGYWYVDNADTYLL